jgi:hypothetical protein
VARVGSFSSLGAVTAVTVASGSVSASFAQKAMKLIPLPSTFGGSSQSGITAASSNGFSGSGS